MTDLYIINHVFMITSYRLCLCVCKSVHMCTFKLTGKIKEFMLMQTYPWVRHESERTDNILTICESFHHEVHLLVTILFPLCVISC